MQTSPPVPGGPRTGPSSPSGQQVYQGVPGSPTLHHRMKQLGGVPTPLAMSSPLRRSNPSTPTQPRRPDFIGIGNEGGRVPPQYYPQYSYEPPHSSHQNGSPQRRYMSESELIRQPPEAGGQYPRTTTMFDNIQELAGSPQHGQYTWRDQSPPQYCQGGPSNPNVVYQTCGSQEYRSNPTSPTQTCPAPHYYPPIHHSQMAGPHGGHYPSTHQPSYNQHMSHQGHQGYPPQQQMVGRRNSGPSYVGPQSPQIRRKNYAGGLVTPPTPTESGRPSPGQKRPVSFVRSLDMMDSIEMSSRGPPHHQGPHGPPHEGHHAVIHSQRSHGGTLSPTHTPKPDHRLTTPQDLDRRSAYDMNYEISV
ncbi:trithorax group protein osa-like [Penaeus monodon]|uniref:trithorax group protein osa-like n=1 Tax=Penaeus monodon TaxID=6687 RepID=UPI0018A76A22|nr:trithorax group protein osa-like [Penaeus monodon]